MIVQFAFKIFLVVPGFRQWNAPVTSTLRIMMF